MASGYTTSNFVMGAKSATTRRCTKPAILLSLLLAMSGCATAGSQQATQGTIGSAEATAEDVAIGPSSEGELASGATAGEEADTGQAEPLAQEPIGPPLPPRSSAEEIVEVVSDIHGPTNDVAAQMNRLARFPDIPTPPGSEVTELRADVRERRQDQSLTISSEVQMTCEGLIDDLVAFYEGSFEELNWTLATRSSLGGGSDRTEEFGYRIPDTPYEQSDVEVWIEAGQPDEPVTIRIRYVEVAEDGGDGSPQRRFEGWVGDLPIPPGGEITGAAIQTSNLGQHTLHFSLAMFYDGLPEPELAGLFRSGLPADDFVIDPQPSMGEILDNWIYLNHPFFTDVRISPHKVGIDGDPVASTVNIDARVGFSPRR